MANKNFTVKNGLEVGGQEVISSSGAITSAALGGQTLGTTDSPTFANATLTGSLRGPSTFTIDPAAVGDNTGTLVIAGNLQVDGTTTTINSTTMTVDDLNLTLASGAANAAAANGAGITVDIAGATNPSLVYGSSNDDWTFNKDLNVTGNGALSGNLDVVGQIGAYDNPGSAWGKMILRATDFEFKNAGGTIVGSIDTSNHFRIINDLHMDSTSPRLDYDNGDSNGSFRLFSTSSNAVTHQFYPNGHAHFITTAGTFKVEGLGGSSNQIESSGSLKVRAVSGHVDLLDGTTEVLNTTTTGVTLPLNLVVNGKLGINENSLSSNARLQVRYDNSQAYSAYNALTNPSMIIKNITAGADKFTSLGFITESNGEGAISLVQGSGNINADMTFSVRSSGTRAEHMRITHDGKVGIGTTDPDQPLHVVGTRPLRLQRSGVGEFEVMIDNTITGDSSDFVIEPVSGTNSSGFQVRTRNASGTLIEALNVNHSGNVGIGLDSPIDSKLVIVETPATIVGGNAINGSTMKGLKLRTNLNSDESVGVWFGTNGSHWSGISGQRKNASSTWGTNLSFYTHEDATNDLTYARERMLIDSAGNVGIGTGAPSFTAVSGSTDQIGLEIQNGNNDSSAHLKLTGRNNTGTPGQATSFEIVHRGDALKTSFIHGGTEVWEFDSSGHAHLGMNDSDTRLTLGSLGTPNTNSSNNIRSVGTILRNNAGGSTGTHEWEINGALKLQIQSSGVLQTTTTGSGDGYDIIARSTDGGDTGLELTRNGVAGFGIAVRAAATDYADFQLNNGGSPSYTETGKMRLYADGSISIPGTALWSSGIGHVFGNTGSHYMIRTSNSAGNESMIISNTIGSGGSTGILQYRNGGSVRGDYLIADHTNGIYFNSTSDYRFKENVVNIPDGILDKLTSLRPITYTHSSDFDDDTATAHSGFIAHEVQEVFPEFVTGTKDALYTQEDLDARGDQTTVTESVGDPLYQTVAYSKKEWNVYIIKALQELKAENEALKARIEVLEG